MYSLFFRDTLFSYHKASELFLQRLVSLYVASHYKVCTSFFLNMKIYFFMNYILVIC